MGVGVGGGGTSLGQWEHNNNSGEEILPFSFLPHFSISKWVGQMLKERICSKSFSLLVTPPPSPLLNENKMLQKWLPFAKMENMEVYPHTINVTIIIKSYYTHQVFLLTDFLGIVAKFMRL